MARLNTTQAAEQNHGQFIRLMRHAIFPSNSGKPVTCNISADRASFSGG
jgi:hypothetical protein